jgi:hypothetical protein
MTQRPVIPVERGSKSVTNNDRRVAYAGGGNLSVDMGNHSRQSKYSSGNAWG